MSVFSNHFSKVLNNHKPTNEDINQEINLREVMHDFDTSPTWEECILTVKELTNDKSPVINKVPPNAFKVMNTNNLRHHFNFILEFWEGTIDVVECHEGQVVPVPKSGDLSDPNKWRGVYLMDIGAKIFSSMLYKNLLK